jgi:hypothetical protein
MEESNDHCSEQAMLSTERRNHSLDPAKLVQSDRSRPLIVEVNCSNNSAWKWRIFEFAVREILSSFIRDLGLWPALLISRFLTNVVPQKTTNFDVLAPASHEISTPKWGG